MTRVIAAPAQPQLVWPATEHLASYAAALRRGWSPDNIRGETAAKEELAEIAEDPALFLARLVDREAKGPPIKLPDGSTATRLPGYRRWVWDGEFCGTIGFRWQPGTCELPPRVLGHIGYSIVPWKRRLGYATFALGAILADVLKEGLAYVEITTDLDNEASQKVILANGGRLVEEFRKPPQFGGKESLRFRIDVRGSVPS